VLAFMLISLGVGFVTATIPPIADSEIPPFGQPLHGVVGGALGVALAAFLVTAGLSGRAGVADLGRRSVRWRVPVRWYLIALFSVPVAATLISLAIYGADERAGPAVARSWPMPWGRRGRSSYGCCGTFAAMAWSVPNAATL